MGYALGIDLGTTFTAAAVVRGDGRPEVVGLGNHAGIIPSTVFLKDDGDLIVGDAAERRGVSTPSRMARAFKRRFGDTLPIVLDRSPYSADRLMTVLLTHVVREVAKSQGGAPDRIALTHPANWGGYKIDLLQQAVQLTGLRDVEFVSEPVAAAIRYASTERMETGDIIAVYDLGGGTFDAAVLRRNSTGFEVLGTPQGIERLGGIDFDDAVMAHVNSVLDGALDRSERGDSSARAALAALRGECVAAKEALSVDSSATVSVMLPNLQSQVSITRGEFEEVVRPLVRETVQTLRRAITEAGVETSQLKAVLLAGGSSRIPLVQEMVRAEFGRPVVFDAHPKHAVALGAAIAAARSTAEASPARVTSTGPASTGSAAPVAPPPGTPPPPVPAMAPVPTTPQTGRSPWVWVGGVAALAVAAVVAVLLLGGSSDDGTTESSISPSGEVTSPENETSTTMIPGADIFTGPSGWTLQVPSTFTPVDDPGTTNEASWSTGNAAVTFANNLGVSVDTGSSMVDLETYMALLRQTVPTIDPDAVVIEDETVVSGGREYGYLTYTVRNGEIVGLFINTVTGEDGVYYVCTYGAGLETDPVELDLVRQVMLTLTPP